MKPTNQATPRFSQWTFLKVALLGFLSLIVAYVLGLLGSFLNDWIGIRFQDLMMFIHTILFGKLFMRWIRLNHLFYKVFAYLFLLYALTVILFIPDILRLANQMNDFSLVLDGSLYAGFAVEFYNPVYWITNFSVGYLIQLLISFACLFLFHLFTSSSANRKKI